MELLQFIENTSLNDKTEPERAKLLCFYHYKENGTQKFSMTLISEYLQNCNFNTPNTSRLKDKLIKGKAKIFITAKDSKNEYEFIPVVLQSLEKEHGVLWDDTETIISDSELIDEVKFCGKYNYLNKIIKQINHSYKYNCYDACAVLMRRLFEILLVLTYQHYDIDAEIKGPNGKNYVMLEKIVQNAKNNKTLKFSRIKSEFDTFRKVGNFSAHNITYIASQKDIDDIKLNYRVMLEELYNKAGLIS